MTKNKKRTAKIFMSFAAQSSKDSGTSFKRYIGVAPVFVKGINPTKAAADAFFGYDTSREPVYISEFNRKVDGVDTKTPQLRLEFLIQTNVEECGVDLKSKIIFFLRKHYRVSAEKGKIQMTNKYGEFAWLPLEDAKNNRVPEEMDNFSSEGMRPAYSGEEDLVKFIKNYLNIPQRAFKVDGETRYIDDAARAECNLSEIENYFKGDLKELNTIPVLKPENTVKVMFGIRNYDGKQYQTVYNADTLKVRVKDHTRLQTSLDDNRKFNRFVDDEYATHDIIEYTVQNTVIAPKAAINPFGDTTVAGVDDLPFDSPTEKPQNPFGL